MPAIESPPAPAESRGGAPGLEFYGIDASSVAYADASKRRFGNVRPAENAGYSGPAESGRPNANYGKTGRGPAQVPQGIPVPGTEGTGQEVIRIGFWPLALRAALFCGSRLRSKRGGIAAGSLPDRGQ